MISTEFSSYDGWDLGTPPPPARSEEAPPLVGTGAPKPLAGTGVSLAGTLPKKMIWYQRPGKEPGTRVPPPPGLTN